MKPSPVNIHDIIPSGWDFFDWAADRGAENFMTLQQIEEAFSDFADGHLIILRTGEETRIEARDL